MAYEGCPNCGKTKTVGEKCGHCDQTAAGNIVPLGTKVICTQCGTMASSGKKLTKGSFIIELFMWLFFILPGVIYSLWRLMSKVTVCRTCAQPTLIPIDSPMAKMQIANLRAAARGV